MYPKVLTPGSGEGQWTRQAPVGAFTGSGVSNCNRTFAIYRVCHLFPFNDVCRFSGFSSRVCSGVH